MVHRFQQYWSRVKARSSDPVLFLIAIVTLIIAAVNVSTKLSDAAGYGAPLPFSNPVTTEFSSAVGIIFILPMLFAFFDRFPFSFKAWYKSLLPYAVASVVFSLIHVGLMVLMRQLAWPPLFGVPYDFFAGGWGELIYEYRKDAITFLLYALVAELQRQVGQAKTTNQPIEPIVLKSGATTILLHPAQFQYAKSAGNYAEVTSISGTQLARTTLSDLEAALKNAGCDVVRIHRSYIVNRRAIMETSPIAAGDLLVKLRGGKTLRASRRYKVRLDN